jgi:uncharacterized membrane protein YoaK (UPF0700 family)
VWDRFRFWQRRVGGSGSSDGNPEPAPVEQDRVFPLCLALTAGFADAFGYLTLHGLLTAHVTGNLAFMAVGLAQGSPRVVMKFLALPIFMLGVGLATIGIAKVNHHRAGALGIALLLEAALFAGALLAGALLPPCRSTDDPTGVCLGTILLMAMATQNAIMRVTLPKLPSTTAMTTNVAEATVQWTHRLIGFGRRLSPEDKTALFARAKTVGLTVSAFALGALCGGLSAARIGYGGLVAPIAILVLLAGRAITRGRPPATERGRDVAAAYPRPAPDSIQSIPPEAAKSRE